MQFSPNWHNQIYLVLVNGCVRIYNLWIVSHPKAIQAPSRFSLWQTALQRGVWITVPSARRSFSWILAVEVLSAQPPSEGDPGPQVGKRASKTFVTHFITLPWAHQPLYFLQWMASAPWLQTRPSHARVIGLTGPLQGTRGGASGLCSQMDLGLSFFICHKETMTFTYKGDCCEEWTPVNA